MKLIIMLFLAGCFFSTSVFACGDRRYTGNEDNYAIHLFYNFYQMRTSASNACTIAKEMAPVAGNWLQTNIPSGSLANTSKQIYNKLYTGKYMKNLRSLLIGGTTIRGGTQLLRTIMAEKKKNKSIYDFQLSVIAPYGYNVINDRDWVNDTERYYSNGKVKKGCGYLVC